MSEANLSSRVSVLGLGNVFLGDDGFGPFIVESFRDRYICSPEIEIIDLGTPGLDLTPYLYDKDFVIIVDAVQAQGEPGTVRTYRESEFLGGTARLRLTDHDIGFEESLAKLRLVDGAPGELIILGVIPRSCNFGDGISSAVLSAASSAIDDIVRLLFYRGIRCQKRPAPFQSQPWWSDA